MASGLDFGLARDAGTLTAMKSSPDYVQAALDRKIVAEPGTRTAMTAQGCTCSRPSCGRPRGDRAGIRPGKPFAPLGIQEILWTSDAQGFTHGWGNLHLKPGDAAKLGYLWLNHGVWDGKQVVPQNGWKTQSRCRSVYQTTKTTTATVGGSNLPSGTYSAKGRGGQYVKLAPVLNVIVTTTGGGYDYDEIDVLLTATLVDVSKPLPANPDGVARLKAAITAVAQPPSPEAGCTLTCRGKGDFGQNLRVLDQILSGLTL